MKKKHVKQFGVGYWITLTIILVMFFNIPNLFCRAGKLFIENKQPVIAYKLLKTAYLVKPKNKDIRYFYVKSMTMLIPIEKIQSEMFKISRGIEKDAAQNLAHLQVNDWKLKILDSIGDNYIEQAPYDSNIVRWDINTFPLKVRIDVPDNTPDYYENEIKKAFTEWSKRTEFLEFEISDDTNSQIIVKFEPLPEDICYEGTCKYVVAYTLPEIKNNVLQTMTITMYDRDANGNYFSDKEIYNTILHEIGHALGIMGHSYSSDDLMFMSSLPEFNITRYRNNFQYLSEDDLNTIKLLYRMIPNITNTPLSQFDKNGLIYAPLILGNEKEIGKRKVLEAKNYIQSAPGLPGGYIDLGVAYADLGKTTEAIDAFRAGLERAQTDNDRYIIYYNIAVTHLNSNNLDDAEAYLELAKDINDTEEIAELYTNIQHARATNTKPFKENTTR
ncbi:matrixin family metalloprotease [bacterium]|nr:matrixin family metalloprotease [bacterium]